MQKHIWKFLFLVIIMSPAAYAENPQTHTLNSYASGVYEVMPDKVTFDIAVETNNPDAGDAQKYVSQNMKEAIADIRALNISGITFATTSNSLNPNYEYINNVSKLRGYHAYQGVQISIENNQFEKDIARVIDLVSRKKVSSINNIQYEISDLKKEEAVLEAIKIGANNAQNRAKSLAKALGVNVLGIVNVTHSVDEYYQPRPMYSANAMLKSGQAETDSTQIEVIKKKITATVNITYEISAK